MSLTRTNIYLDEKQLERLRAKGERDHLPVSEIVRRAIDAYLAWDDPTYSPTPINSRKERACASPCLKCRGFQARRSVTYSEKACQGRECFEG